MTIKTMTIGKTTTSCNSPVRVLLSRSVFLARLVRRSNITAARLDPGRTRLVKTLFVDAGREDESIRGWERK
jgi:hypothetical protein